MKLLLKIDNLLIIKYITGLRYHPDGNLFGSDRCPVLQVAANRLESSALFVQEYLSRYGNLRFTVIL
jgi:hypothetical protein